MFVKQLFAALKTNFSLDKHIPKNKHALLKTLFGINFVLSTEKYSVSNMQKDTGVSLGFWYRYNFHRSSHTQIKQNDRLRYDYNWGNNCPAFICELHKRAWYIS